MKKTYHLILIAFICIMSINAFSQVPRFYRPVMGGSSSGNEIVKSIVGDNAGNVYVAGTFTSTSFTLGGITLTNNGGSDIFIAKYSNEGLVLWATSAGGLGADTVTGIATDNAGYLYITGYFNSSSITFGTTTLTNASAGTNDIFIAKYDISGNATSAVRAGGTGNDNANAITIDLNNNIYVTGNFTSSSFQFGSTSALSLVGTQDIFYAQYNTGLTALWSNSAGGFMGIENAKGIAADASGNIFITGGFNAGSFTLGTFSLTQQSDYDIYVTKINSAGTVLWANSLGGAGTDIGTGIITDVSGNVFITATYSSTNLTDGNTIMQVSTNSGGKDIVTVKYNNSGTLVWAKRIGGSGDEIANAINTDACGYIYVCGSFNSPGNITVGPTTLNDSTSTSNALMLLKYDGTGNALWGKQVISAGGNQGTAVSGNISNNVIVAGYTASTNVYLGGNHIANSDASGTTYDFFLAKVQTTATDIYVFTNNAAAAPINYCKVYLYARQTNYRYLHPQDSVILSGSNIAHFASVLNLTYFVKVIADTMHYSNQYVTTYNGNKNLWDSIVTWPHTCSTNDSIYITMTANTNNPSIGHGKIIGRVTKGYGYASFGAIGNQPKNLGDPIPGIDVKIGRNPGGQMVTNTSTDNSGQYTFNNIDTGNYKIYVDIPGLNRDSTYTVIVSATDTIFAQRDYIADSNHVYIDSTLTAVPLNNNEYGVIIAPNPFHYYTTITLPLSDKQHPITIRVLDILGNEVRNLQVSETKEYILENGNMSAGIYFVQIITPERNLINKKIVVQ